MPPLNSMIALNSRLFISADSIIKVEYVAQELEENDFIEITTNEPAIYQVKGADMQLFAQSLLMETQS